MSTIDELLNYVEDEGITKSDEDAVRSARQELTRLRTALSEARELISDAEDVSCEPYTSRARVWLERTKA